MFSDYRIADSTCEAPPVQITFNTAVAATIISLLWLPLAHADDRPSGIPDSVRAPPLRKVIIKGLNETPEEFHLGAAGLVHNTFAKAFPC